MALDCDALRRSPASRSQSGSVPLGFSVFCWPARRWSNNDQEQQRAAYIPSFVKTVNATPRL
ncbi:hypothetical protein N7468_008903 [Penicillium chermesinum]|uniref:Uncharacterized protein n=1 Tax=Penicillium chermesinum TaxID=63820 RepID=A0A9W9NJC6_9EURO|nr:uncharacterized protein N7468_008903 [Penicillium chermesinum]KAJ5219699.1 hypothetical protein N7468_008903 [Penicillium chermesinum]KAJ6153699.1 hypothetical protein N7470_006658 [Penicillium chermesinum]